MFLGQIGQAIQVFRRQRVIFRRNQPQMAGGNRQRFVTRNAAEQGDFRQSAGHDPGQQFGMASATHVIENHPGQPDVRIELGEPLDKSRSTGRHAARIDHQHHRSTADSGYLGTAPLQGGGPEAIEEPHDRLDHSHISGSGMQTEGFRHERLRAHPTIQVDGNPAACHAMVTGIDEIRPALEGRDHQSPPSERGHDGQGDGGLAAATLGSGYQKAVYAHLRDLLVMPY